MATPFISEIRLMSFNFPPKGWALCNGQFLAIAQNQALFSLLGTTYGGNGQTTFALPDLRGRVPLHMSLGHPIGERGGEEAHQLSTAEMPTHTHVVNASASATGGSANPTNNYLGGGNNVYAAAGTPTTLQAQTVTSIGASQAHPNMQPYLTLSFCIALQGVFPSQS